MNKVSNFIVDSLNSIQTTVWGIIVLFISMLMCWHGKTNEGYYFAGVGSTLLGIKSEQVAQKLEVNKNAAPNA